MEQSILFWTKVAAVGQVAGALATFAAVVVALYISRREQRISVRVTARFGVLATVTGQTQVMIYEIENIGLRPVTVSGMHWTTGWTTRFIWLPKILRLRSAFQLPDYAWGINPNFPWRLEPGEARSTHMRREEFVASFAEEPEGLFRCVPWHKHPVLLNHRVGAGVTTLPRVVFGKVDPSITATLTGAYRENHA